MKRLVLFWTLLFLATPINLKCTPLTVFQNIYRNPTDQSCPVNSHCMQNGFCDCDLGYIGGCTQPAFRMQHQTQIISLVNNQTYTFFQIQGTSETYMQLTFTFCMQEKDASSDFQIDVWTDSGKIDTLTKQNAEKGGKSWSITNSCLNLNTPFMQLGSKTNGQPQSFIIGLKKVQPGSDQLKVRMQISQMDFWGLMAKIIMRLAACFILALSAVIIYAVYKWRRRRSLTQIRNNKDISHLDDFMPKIKLEPNESESMAQELCSICLLELGDTMYLRKTVCFHVFHQDCLDSWCKTHLNCPVCRRSFQQKDLRINAESVEGSMSKSLRRALLG